MSPQRGLGSMWTMTLISLIIRYNIFTHILIHDRAMKQAVKPGYVCFWTLLNSWRHVFFCLSSFKPLRLEIQSKTLIEHQAQPVVLRGSARYERKYPTGPWPAEEDYHFILERCFIVRNGSLIIYWFRACMYVFPRGGWTSTTTSHISRFQGYKVDPEPP